MDNAEIAAQADLHPRTVQQIVRRHGDLAKVTTELQGEYLSAGFKYFWLDTLNAWRESIESGQGLTAQDRKNLALAAAISVDKVAMIQGWPTQVVAHLHEHRHEVGDIADKLAAVARRIGAYQE